MIDIKKLGENIRKERKRQLLTIEQLAEKAGITDNFLGKIERGEGTPSLQTIDSIACALNVGIDFLNGNVLHNTEHKFITSLIEINGLSEDSKERFIDFISTNIKYFKQAIRKGIQIRTLEDLAKTSRFNIRKSRKTICGYSQITLDIYEHFCYTNTINKTKER